MSLRDDDDDFEQPATAGGGSGGWSLRNLFSRDSNPAHQAQLERSAPVPSITALGWNTNTPVAASTAQSHQRHVQPFQSSADGINSLGTPTHAPLAEPLRSSLSFALPGSTGLRPKTPGHVTMSTNAISPSMCSPAVTNVSSRATTPTEISTVDARGCSTGCGEQCRRKLQTMSRMVEEAEEKAGHATAELAEMSKRAEEADRRAATISRKMQVKIDEAVSAREKVELDMRMATESKAADSSLLAEERARVDELRVKLGQATREADRARAEAQRIAAEAAEAAAAAEAEMASKVTNQPISSEPTPREVDTAELEDARSAGHEEGRAEGVSIGIEKGRNEAHLQLSSELNRVKATNTVMENRAKLAELRSSEQSAALEASEESRTRSDLEVARLAKLQIGMPSSHTRLLIAPTSHIGSKAFLGPSACKEDPTRVNASCSMLQHDCTRKPGCIGGIGMHTSIGIESPHMGPFSEFANNKRNVAENGASVDFTHPALSDTCVSWHGADVGLIRLFDTPSAADRMQQEDMNVVMADYTNNARRLIEKRRDILNAVTAIA